MERRRLLVTAVRRAGSAVVGMYLPLMAAAGASAETLFVDVTLTNIPVNVAKTMDAAMADVDGDGDLDIALAMEYQPNILLINDGRGFFHDGTAEILPPTARGFGFDIAAGDVDGDRAVDLYLAGRESRDRLLLSTAGPCTRQVCPQASSRRAGRRVAP